MVTREVGFHAAGPMIFLAVLGGASCDDDDAAPQPAASTSATSSATDMELLPLPSATPKPDGPNRWLDFPGKHALVELTGPRQWAAVPAGRRWDSLKIALLPYDGPEGDEHSFDGGKLFVPGAFVHAAGRPEKIIPGAPVRVSLDGTTVPGRVVRVDDDQATVSVEWVDDVKEEKVPLGALLLLGGGTFGDPIAYEDEGVSRHGELVSRGEVTSWIITWGGKPKQVPTQSIRHVDVGRIFAPGDRVMATFVGRFTTAAVVRVESNGVRYVVDRKEGGIETLSFTEVTAPPW